MVLPKLKLVSQAAFIMMALAWATVFEGDVNAQMRGYTPPHGQGPTGIHGPTGISLPKGTDLPARTDLPPGISLPTGTNLPGGAPTGEQNPQQSVSMDPAETQAEVERLSREHLTTLKRTLKTP